MSESEVKRRIAKVEDIKPAPKERLVVRGPLMWCLPGSNGEDVSKGCLAGIECRRMECLADACPDYQAPKEDP